jgi:hypothetical protein
MDEALSAGRTRIVLDNTYPTRASRNAVIETAWRRGLHVRCIWITTPAFQAQINAVRRMIDAHGSLPSPEEIRSRSKKDTRYMLPDAQFRFERSLEQPSLEEGFESVEQRAPVPDEGELPNRALLLDLDDLNSRNHSDTRDAIARYRNAGWLVFVHAWRPQIARGEIQPADVESLFAELRRSIGDPIEWAYCPHDAGPPVCWCRKPLPGPAIVFAARFAVALSRSIVVGTSAADRTMAERIGARFETALPDVNA